MPATPDSGRINEAWDRDFLVRWAANDRAALTAYSDAEIYAEAGQGGFEIRTYVAAAAAAGRKGQVLYADRLLLREGKKPGAPEDEAVQVGADSPTFATWAATHAGNLAPPKDDGTWLRQMTKTTGKFGKLPIDTIKAADVKALLLPYWYSTPTQAVVICQRISRVLKHRHRNIRPADPIANPADPSLIGDMMGRRRKHVTRHHPSLPYEDVPDFMHELRADPVMSARVVESAILTGVRINKEATLAKWGEID